MQINVKTYFRDIPILYPIQAKVFVLICNKTPDGGMELLRFSQEA
jgi:hypothetical protein